jgi:hypothetical protein
MRPLLGRLEPFPFTAAHGPAGAARTLRGPEIAGVLERGLDGAGGLHRLMTKQPCCSAMSWVQASVAAAWVGNGPVWSR